MAGARFVLPPAVPNSWSQRPLPHSLWSLPGLDEAWGNSYEARAKSATVRLYIISWWTKMFCSHLFLKTNKQKKNLENVGKFKSTALELNLWSNLFRNTLSPGNFITSLELEVDPRLSKILVSVLHPRELKNVGKAGKWRKSFSSLWHAVVQTVNVQQFSVSCISPPYFSNYISDRFCLGVRSAHLQVILGCSEQEGKSGSWRRRTRSWFMCAVWEYCNH